MFLTGMCSMVGVSLGSLLNQFGHVSLRASSANGNNADLPVQPTDLFTHHNSDFFTCEDGETIHVDSTLTEV